MNVKYQMEAANINVLILTAVTLVSAMKDFY